MKDYRAACNALTKFYPLTLDNLDGEEWKDIHGYEGLYQVSNCGRVKSFQRGSVKILKAAIKNFYPFVELNQKGKAKQFLIHRLVAQAFISNPEGKPQVNHIDGQKFNNHVDNLEWVTGSENQQHAVLNGLIKSGGDNYASYISNEQAVWIRDNPDNLSQPQLAKKFNTTQKTISSIQLRKTYKLVGGKERILIPPKPPVPLDIREEIRRVYIKGDSQYGARSLARKYGYSKATIQRIVHEK